MTEDEATILTDQIACLCKLEDDELSEWEAEFVDSVSNQYVWRLSEKQRELIKKLYTREC